MQYQPLTTELFTTTLGITLDRVLEMQSSVVTSLAFEPEGRWFASGNADGAIRLWDLSSNLPKHILQAGNPSIPNVDCESKAVRTLAFKPQGQLLASGCGDLILMWGIESPKLRQSLTEHMSNPPGSSLVSKVAYDTSGHVLASVAEGTIFFRDVRRGKVNHTLLTGQLAIWDMVFDPKRAQLATSSFDGDVRIWDLNRCQIIRVLGGHQNAVSSIAYHPQRRLLASGGYDRKVLIWDTDSGRILRSLEGQMGTVENVAFSPDGRVLATSNSHDGIWLWRCDNWTVVAKLAMRFSHNLGLAKNMTFHPHKMLLAASGSAPFDGPGELGRRIFLWSLDTDVLLPKR